MKNKMSKTQIKKKEIKFNRIDGPDGWTLDYNKNVDRFDLRHNGVLEYSHFNSIVCQNIAQNRFGIDMYRKEEIK